MHGGNPRKTNNRRPLVHRVQLWYAYSLGAGIGVRIDKISLLFLFSTSEQPRLDADFGCEALLRMKNTVMAKSSEKPPCDSCGSSHMRS